MFAIHRQLFDPTGVENSIFCNFTSTKHKVLITSAASQLTIYKIKEKYHNATKEELTKNFENYESSSFDGVLETIGSWSLFGNIISMKNISMGLDQLDLLLLSFLNGKLSVVEFDLEAFDIKTSSIHDFEDVIARHGMLQGTTRPEIAVDPENRCAAMTLNNFNIAVVAFHEGYVNSDISTHQGSLIRKRISSYDISLKDVDQKAQRIKDIEFLHGYYEPTLLVLYEAPITWSGRVSTRQDTCNIIALSLNTTEKPHPVIWSLKNLPYNGFKVHPVPKPIGGVLVFSASSLVYLNQSVPAYGVSLNSTTETSTSFILKTQDGVCMDMDHCRATFISNDAILVCLKNSEMYVVTLQVDNMRSIRGFHFDRITTSVPPTSMTLLDHDFVFVGSRLAYPQLIRTFKVKKDPLQDAVVPAAAAVVEPGSDEEKENKEGLISEQDKQRMEVEKVYPDEFDINMYGDEENENVDITSYEFVVCDSLVNIGPCGGAELGMPTVSDEFSNQQESALEAVLLSGKDEHSSLSILQHTIKPMVVTSFGLPGCDDLWTLNTREQQKENDYHSYLLISREDSTLVLETCRTEIKEVDNSGYTMEEPSVFVGNLQSGAILQVCTTSASLIDGTALVHKISLELDSPIQHCTLDDPYAVLLTADGQVVILTVLKNYEGIDHMLQVTNSSIPQVPQITSISLYCDRSGIFTTYDDTTTTTAAADDSVPMSDIEDANKFYNGNADGKNLLATNTKNTSLDDEDELLYGCSTATKSTDDKQLDNKVNHDDEMLTELNMLNEQMNETEQINEQQSYPTCSSVKSRWLVVIRKYVHLEIYDLETHKLAFAVPNFAYGRQVLIDCSANYELEKPESNPVEQNTSDTEYNILEICLLGLDKEGQYPYLLARQSDQIMIYKAYSFENTKNYIVNQGLKVRFKKVDHGIMTRKPSTLTDFLDPSSFRPCFRYFDNISGYSGVFLCGPYPHWIIATSRGDIRCHPMNVDGRVSCFAMFHNINCSHGFIYFNRQSELRISKFTPNIRYDTEWPMRRVHLNSTAHFVSYSIEHKVYSLVTSDSVECRRLPYLNCENEREFEDLERGDNFIYPRVDQFQLKLFSPITWESIPNTTMDLEDFEHVTCMKNVWLTPSAHSPIRHNYVALGTTYTMGEEMTSRGRIVIVEVIEVVPEPGKPQTKNRFKQVYAGEQRGPVSALCHVEGNLLSAIGQKVFIWKFDSDGSLTGLAFVDTNTYITQALNFRSFALLGDVKRSITLLRYQEEFKTLALQSRDVNPMEVYSLDLMVDGNQCAFVAADSEKNLSFFQFDPQAPESHGGSRLVKRGDFHLGQHVYDSMWRVGTVQMDRATGITNDTYSVSHITMMATLDGGISSLVPVAEKLYRRLTMLQNYLYNSSPHTAGLNPREFRTTKSQLKSLSNPVKGILDGNLLWKYHNLTKVAKHELARKIGSTSEQLADDLMELHRSTCVM